MTFKKLLTKYVVLSLKSIKKYFISLFDSKQVVIVTPYSTKFVKRYGIVNIVVSIFIGVIVSVFIVKYNKYKNYNNYSKILEENEMLKKQYDDVDKHFRDIVKQIDKINEYLKVNNPDDLKYVDFELKDKKVRKSNYEMKQVLNKKIALSYKKLEGRKKYLALAINKLGISHIKYNKIVKTANIQQDINVDDIISNTIDDKYIGGNDSEVKRIKMVKTKPLLYVSEKNIDHSNYNSEIGKLIDIENTIHMLPFGVPTDDVYRITSSYGFRDLENNGNIKLHSGIDIVVKNDRITTPSSGVVQFAGNKQGYGNCVEIDHSYGKKYIVTRYAHLKDIKVTKGQILDSGDIIGIQGATGHVTGRHLHYEIIIGNIPVNPAKFINIKSIDNF